MGSQWQVFFCTVVTTAPGLNRGQNYSTEANERYLHGELESLKAEGHREDESFIEGNAVLHKQRKSRLTLCASTVLTEDSVQAM